jgi:hypothetical protein
MTLAALAPEEREVVRLTMQATFRYFDSDFQTRLGVSMEAMQALLDGWPRINDEIIGSDASLAINNSFNDLLHGVGISEDEAKEYVGVGRAEMQRVYCKWAAARRCKQTGIR